MFRKIVLIIVMFLLVSLVGCGESNISDIAGTEKGKAHGIKTDDELLADLVENPKFYKVEGSKVTGLSVIKRLTDEENRKDTVYVTIKIDHEAASATQAYIMYYTRYNEGWLLDSIEAYYGDEVKWEVRPKGVPTNEQIMEALIAHSNEQIKASYEETFGYKELKDTYFFEEGKYFSEIYTGERVTEYQYNCIVKTTRVFNYVEVQETQLLKFVFGGSSYSWNLCDDEIVELTGDWYLDGQYRIPSNGATLTIDCIYENGDKNEAKFKVVSSSKGENLEKTMLLWYPSTQSIDVGHCSFNSMFWNGVWFDIQISPDMKYGYDWKIEYYFEPEVIQIDNSPSRLEVVGVVDKSTNADAEKYKSTAKNILDNIFIIRNIASVKDMMYPGKDPEVLWQIENIVLPEGYKAKELTHMQTQAIKKDDTEYKEDFEHYQEAGIDVDALAMSMFYLEMVSGDGEKEFQEVGVLLGAKGDRIYILEIGG